MTGVWVWIGFVFSERPSLGLYMLPRWIPGRIESDNGDLYRYLNERYETLLLHPLYFLTRRFFLPRSVRTVSSPAVPYHPNNAIVQRPWEHHSTPNPSRRVRESIHPLFLSVDGKTGRATLPRARTRVSSLEATALISGFVRMMGAYWRVRPHLSCISSSVAT